MLMSSTVQIPLDGDYNKERQKQRLQPCTRITGHRPLQIRREGFPPKNQFTFWRFPNSPHPLMQNMSPPIFSLPPLNRIGILRLGQFCLSYVLKYTKQQETTKCCVVLCCFVLCCVVLCCVVQEGGGSNLCSAPVLSLPLPHCGDKNEMMTFLLHLKVICFSSKQKYLRHFAKALHWLIFKQKWGCFCTKLGPQ